MFCVCTVHCTYVGLYSALQAHNFLCCHRHYNVSKDQSQKATKEKKQIVKMVDEEYN